MLLPGVDVAFRPTLPDRPERRAECFGVHLHRFDAAGERSFDDRPRRPGRRRGAASIRLAQSARRRGEVTVEPRSRYPSRSLRSTCHTDPILVAGNWPSRTYRYAVM